MNKTGSKVLTEAREVASFFVPIDYRGQVTSSANTPKKVVVLIPTYKPTSITSKLVKDIVNFNSDVRVIVIDDCTPIDESLSMQVIQSIKSLSRRNRRITVLRTSENQLKAGALNLGLSYVHDKKINPQVVITLDDDVVITKNTINALVTALYSRPHLGVVCSRALVKNKNKNMLTRLQGLEYNGFNVTKIGDNGFLYGPLVMQGMLSAFRYTALKQVKGFDTKGLIEDYEITVRIKKAGWHAGFVNEAIAYTHVPEAWGNLWRQRVRWSYGGLLVMKSHWRYIRAVFQDFLGHFLFLSLFTLILLSFVFEKTYDSPMILIDALFAISIFHFAFSFSFGIASLLLMENRDRRDWVIRLTVFPEFVYSNLLSLILVGSYMFYLFHFTFEKAYQMIPRLFKLQARGDRIFKKLGYSLAWGTRA